MSTSNRLPETEALAQDCATLYQQRRYSIRAVAAELGYSFSYVRELLVDVAGVELRDHAGRPRKAAA
ncbi:helix-turn-helix domain-containing protein [Streptomyces sp. NBC_00519]|uniref:helix-turn-helix domain-containing protein n=1 Tax=Streptomyces sp. NBC_00519 TaxID=2975764 RepID=UPI0030E5B89F